MCLWQDAKIWALQEKEKDQLNFIQNMNDTIKKTKIQITDQEKICVKQKSGKWLISRIHKEIF